MGKMGSWYSLITRQYSPCWLFGSPSAQSNQLTVSFLKKILKFNGISDLKKEVLTWKLPCEARSTLLERDRCAVLQSRLQARTAPSSRASSRPAPSTSASSWYLDINSHIEWHLFLLWHLWWHLSWQGRTIYDSVKVWHDPDKGDGAIKTCCLMFDFTLPGWSSSATQAPRPAQRISASSLVTADHSLILKHLQPDLSSSFSQPSGQL